MITSKSDMKTYLQESNRDVFGNRPWQQARANVDYSKQLAESKINQQFGKDVGTAYAAAQQQRSAVLGSGLGQGYQKQLLSDLDTSMAEAYNSYLSTAQQQKQAVAQSTQSIYKDIDETQDTWAENYANYQEQHFNYYQYLVDNYSDVLLQDEMFRGYFVDDIITDDKGNPVLDKKGNIQYRTDEDGNKLQRLKTIDELLTNEYDEVDGRKEWKGLFDTNGDLTIRGVDFFDLMQNYFAGHSGAESFDQYLKEQNEELYDWSKSYNPWNYTAAGTNRGSFKTMVGMTSTDYTYEFAERFGGLTTGEVKEMYSDFTKQLEQLLSYSEEDYELSSKKTTELIKSSTSNLRNIADQLGITEEELGVNWDTLESRLKLLYNETKSDAKMTGEWFGQFTPLFLENAIAGAGIGSVIPGFGTAAGGVIGGFIGLVEGIIAGTTKVRDSLADNQRFVELARDQYADIVNTMVNYSLQKRRQVEIDYYNKGFNI